MIRVGIVSDTHGLLRDEALAALEGSDAILHAGDVGAEGVLERLRELAPVHAVRGNVDVGPWAEALPLSRTLSFEGIRLLLHHGHVVPPDADLASVDVVVQGHSHRPEVERRGGRLFVNPGSAGRRRFRLPVTVALLRVEGDRSEAELVDLSARAHGARRAGG